jgi:formate--tetrahydrofolate ligase
MQPNLVQTLENNPAFIHGGPFANIAHGCNSVMATKTALKLADYVVTEAGFGADLGAEKFFDIKCRSAGLKPSAAVIVATVRALKMHGGVARDALSKPNVEALKKGCANLGRHIDNVKQFGVPVVVAINNFTTDTAEEVAAVKEFAKTHGVEAILCEHWAKGSEGAEELARAVVKLAESGAAQFAPLYDLNLPLFEKITQIATRIYRAEEAVADKKIRDQLKAWDEEGYSKLPVCMAKTQYSFSTDPNLRGAPTHHVVPIREVRLAAGAGFVVAICGEIMTMPGLPKVPAAETIGLDADGLVEGLF